MKNIQHTFTEDQTKRADIILTEMFDDYSRGYIQKLIKNGDITCNGKIIKRTHLFVTNDIVDISIENTQLDILAQDMPIDILHQDANMVVLNKDAHMNVHPVDGEGGRENTLVNALLFHIDDLSSINGVQRPGIVHRLDKDTTGVIVVAKNDTTMTSLQALFAKRETNKIYHAIVFGVPAHESGRIESSIGRDPHHRKKMTVHDPINPKEAITEYRTISSVDISFGGNMRSASLLEVKIHTGRTHQIRVHLDALGTPVVGDTLYGHEKWNKQMAKMFGTKRQMLHARSLGFRLDDADYSFDAEYKKDMQHLINAIDLKKACNNS